MGAHVRANLWLLGLTLLICCVLYPLALWAVGGALFPEAAGGSIVDGPDGKPVGSRLVAQGFGGDEYFWPRPSAVGYNAAGSGGSNYGASNPKLRDRVARDVAKLVKYRSGPRAGRRAGPDVQQWLAEDPSRVADWIRADPLHAAYVAGWAEAHPEVTVAWRAENPSATAGPKPEDLAAPFAASYLKAHPGTWPQASEEKEGDRTVKRLKPAEDATDVQGMFFERWLEAHPEADLDPVPADLVTASGSGLDPHISLRGARYQFDRVAAARAAKLRRDPAAVRRQVEEVLGRHAFMPLAGLVGEPLVNVLEVNRELHRLFEQPSP